MKRIWYAINPIFWTILFVCLFVGALIGVVVFQWALILFTVGIVLYLLIFTLVDTVKARLKEYDETENWEKDKQHGFGYGE